MVIVPVVSPAAIVKVLLVPIKVHGDHDVSLLLLLVLLLQKPGDGLSYNDCRLRLLLVDRCYWPKTLLPLEFEASAS